MCSSVFTSINFISLSFAFVWFKINNNLKIIVNTVRNRFIYMENLT
jgi:hypothetical protein